MERKKSILDAIFADDPLGLLRVKPSTSVARNVDERLAAAFQEITDFFEKNQRLPSADGGVQEHQLVSRLKNLQNDPRKVEILKGADRHGLLAMRLPDLPQEIENQGFKDKIIDSFDDIFADDFFKIFEDATADSLFDLKHVARPDDRADADFVARRKPCRDFEKHETAFKTVQKDLAGGQRKLLPFKEDNLRAGQFYVQNGILLFLEKVEIEAKTEDYKSGIRNRKDGRTRVIFENGTESNMLYRSLYKAILANGKAVSEHENEVAEQLAKNFNQITDEDETTGFIYVLKSKSQKTEIKSIKNLYKIGYSTTPVEQRTKNAAQEPTYLMADVAIVSEFKCFNLNPQRFEQLLHNFFGEVCLQVDVFDKKGERYTPREWFVAPLPVIGRVIELIISGDIVRFRYDATGEEIAEK